MAPSQFAHDVVSIVKEIANLDWMISTWSENEFTVLCNKNKPRKIALWGGSVTMAAGVRKKIIRWEIENQKWRLTEEEKSIWSHDKSSTRQGWIR